MTPRSTANTLALRILAAYSELLALSAGNHHRTTATAIEALLVAVTKKLRSFPEDPFLPYSIPMLAGAILLSGTHVLTLAVIATRYGSTKIRKATFKLGLPLMLLHVLVRAFHPNFR